MSSFQLYSVDSETKLEEQVVLPGVWRVVLPGVWRVVLPGVWRVSI